MITDLKQFGRSYIENYLDEYENKENSKIKKVDDVMTEILKKVIGDYERSFENCSPSEKIFFELLTSDFVDLVQLTIHAFDLLEDKEKEEIQ